jgi:nucleotide-binding universal stress UspA family protein
MRKALIPYDGSESSMRALRYAISMEKEHPGGQLYLLHVADPTTYFALDEEVFNPNEKERMLENAERTLLRAKKILDEAGLSYESEVSLGVPGNDIPAKARARGCNLIIMGTRGMSSMASFFVGSVAQRVIHNSDIPVLLVK